MEQRSPMSFLSSTAAIEDALLSEDMLLEILSHMTPLTKALFSLTCKYLYLKWKDEEKEEFRGSDMAERIAGEGNVDMLRWAIEDLHSPITSDAANEAASHDNLANLKYLKSKNCPMYRSMVECALSSGSMAVLQWMHSVDYKWIASLPARTLCSPQHLRVILFLIQFGYLKTISKEFVSEAAEKGHLDKLRWAVQNRVELDAIDVGNKAAAGGHLEALQLLVCLKVPIHLANALDFAVSRNQSHIVKYLIEEKGVEVKSYHMTTAIKKNNVPMVEYLLTHGGEWCWRCRATINEHPNRYNLVFQYAIDNNLL